MWKIASSVHTLRSHHFSNVFFLIRFEILISLKLLKFCDKNYFCSKVAYGYKLDIHDKNSSVNATFFTVNGPKTDLFAIFWLWKIILGYLRFCDQNHFWSKVAYEYKLDIHEKNFTVTPLFQQLMVQKLFFLQFFDFVKLF